MWKLPGWIRGDCKVILLLIGAKIILSQVELALALMIEEGASRKKHCMLCILFAFGALTELAMLAGWIRVLFPAVYERKEDFGICCIPCFKMLVLGEIFEKNLYGRGFRGLEAGFWYRRGRHRLMQAIERRCALEALIGRLDDYQKAGI